MAHEILVCELNENVGSELKTYFESLGHKVQITNNGKDCQLKAYHQKFSFLILNLDVTNHSGLQVLKYFRLTHPSVKVILTLNNDNRFKELDITKKDLQELGAFEVIIHPYQFVDLTRMIDGDHELSLNKIKAEFPSQTNSSEDETELKASDSNKFMEEIYTVGFSPQIIEEGQKICEEGQKICENILNIIKDDEGLHKLLKEFEDYDPPTYAHLFLTSFLTTVISKNLDWSSARTTNLIAFAGLLHDIGTIKLPEEIRSLTAGELSPEQHKIYQQHSRDGADILQGFKAISQPIIQIIYQHHEAEDGSGFPNELSGMKIYPPAKVLALADHFANILTRERVTPLEGLKILISGPEQASLRKFDSDVIRALIKGFIKK